MLKPTKMWKESPSTKEILKYINEFFQVLSAGEIDKAEKMVHHGNTYWENQVYEIWKFHNAEKVAAKDKSYEGDEWKKRENWVTPLTVSDKIVQWISKDKARRRFVVALLSKGKPTGYGADFQVAYNDDGEFYVGLVLFTELETHPWR